MSDFAETMRGWDIYDGSKDDEYERLLAAYKQAVLDRDEAVAALERLEGADNRMMGINTTTSKVFQWVQRQRDDARSVARDYRRCIFDMIELGWVKQKSKALALLDKDLNDRPWLGEKDKDRA